MHTSADELQLTGQSLVKGFYRFLVSVFYPSFLFRLYIFITRRMNILKIFLTLLGLAKEGNQIYSVSI